MQIQTTLSFPLTLFKLEKMTDMVNGNCYTGYRKTGSLLVEQRIGSTFWKAIWYKIQNVIKLCVPFDTAVPITHIPRYPKEIKERWKRTHIHKNIYSSTFCHSKIMEIK